RHPDDHTSEGLPIAAAKPPYRDEDWKDLQVRCEGNCPRRTQSEQESHDDLGLTDNERPAPGERQDRDEVATCRASPVDPPQGYSEARDDHTHPDGCGQRERKQSKRSEGDGEQRWVAVESRLVWRRRLVIQGQTRVQAGASVVVGVNV